MKKRKWLVSTAACFMLWSSSITTSAFAKTVTTEQQLIKEVQRSMVNLNSNYSITYTGKKIDFNAVINKAIQTEGTVLSTLSSYGYSASSVANSNTTNLTYQFKYYTTKNKNARATKLLDAEVAKIKKTYKTDVDRIKAVNDYIVLNTRYGGLTTDRYSMYGVALNKQAVCQGYASTAYYMLKKLGFQTYYVTGNANGLRHAWNKVKVDGSWYNLDVTWNDPVPNIANQVSYKYFLLSDKMLNRDHQADKGINYPKATNTKFDFLKNTSSLTQNGTTLYYANDSDHQYLYSFNMKTNKHKRIAKTRVQYIQYYKGKIYFSNYSNNGYLANISSTGKSIKVIVKKPVSKLFLKKNVLYYHMSGKTVKKVL
ncbi:transglutaminase domain-containing protein [Kurthia senegalensis]|uniref:transglutaminase domain-containing protein n=1 Tax=Kurthia senegalensis TaxID=1033740 RepID=UPI000288CAA0|nr:transglutaminase domain-containing protein [Kurthia senegalensis]